MFLVDQTIGLTALETVLAALLLLSVAANAFQLVRRRSLARILEHGFGTTFTGTAWLIARCMTKATALGLRAWNAERTASPEVCVLREFQNFCRETELMLRLHHEHLVSVARLVPSDRRRRKGGRDVIVEEVERARRMLLS